MHKQEDFRPGHLPSQQTIKRVELDKACRNCATGWSLPCAADAPLIYRMLVNIPQKTECSIWDVQVSFPIALKCLGFRDSYQAVPFYFKSADSVQMWNGNKGGMGFFLFFFLIMWRPATESLHPLSVTSFFFTNATSVRRNLLALTNLTNRNTIWQLLWLKYSRESGLSW